MGLWDALKGELIDVIEWNEPSESDILCWRFPRYNNEIKMGAQLIVREGQFGLFVKSGELADGFAPGRYTLSTMNLPILTKLLSLPFGFNSPFKAEVYYVSTRQWTDQKWGTSNPIMMRDADFGVVRVRAFGTYAFKIIDPTVFLRQLVASDPEFNTFEISNQLRSTIVSRFVDVIGTAKIPVLELAGNYERVSKLALERIAADVMGMGLALTQFYIENISLPPEVEQALDTRTKMGVLGDLNRYTQLQAADAIRDAAQNPGGLAGAGASLGAGVAIGQAMTGALGAVSGVPAAAPPPIPSAVSFFAAIDGAQAGPFDLSALQAKVASGEVGRGTLVWKQGMANWAAADSVPELQGLLAHLPPPLPG